MKTNEIICVLNNGFLTTINTGSLRYELCALFQPGTLNPWPRPGSYTDSIDLTVASV